MDKEAILGLTRFGTEIVVASVVTNVIMKNLPETESKITKVFWGIGTFIISSVVSTKCSDEVLKVIEAFIEGYEIQKQHTDELGK